MGSTCKSPRVESSSLIEAGPREEATHSHKTAAHGEIEPPRFLGHRSRSSDANTDRMGAGHGRCCGGITVLMISQTGGRLVMSKLIRAAAVLSCFSLALAADYAFAQ